MKIKYLLILMLTTLGLASCNDEFLNKNPLDKISSDVYYKNETQVNIALTACTARMMCGGWDGNISHLMGVCSSNAIFDCFADNGYIKWGFLGITSGNLTPANEAVNTLYQDAYGSIAIFNDFIANMESGKVTFLNEDVRKRYIAEVKFMRAWVYFTLTNL